MLRFLGAPRQLLVFVVLGLLLLGFRQLALAGEGMHSGDMEMTTPEYWEKYYQKNTAEDDWFVDYAQGKKGSRLKDALRRLIPDLNAKILHLGAGTSGLSHGMYKDGYTSIHSTDISAKAVEVLRERQQKLKGDTSGLTVAVDDCRNSSAPTAAFDYVLDKGTLDVIFSSMDVAQRKAALSETRRALRPVTGRLISVSFDPPDERLELLHTPLERLELLDGAVGPFACEVEELPKPYPSEYSRRKEFYIYICRPDAAAAGRPGDAAPGDREL